MQDSRDLGQEGCRTGGMRNRKDTGQEGTRTVEMHDRRDAGQKGWMIGWRQDRRNTGKTGEIPDRRNTGQGRCTGKKSSRTGGTKKYVFLPVRPYRFIRLEIWQTCCVQHFIA